jgi:dTDP-4-dehydrorhamnose reductase
MKNILVTGGNGQLGSSLHSISPSFQGFAFSFIDVEDLDLTNADEVNKFFRGRQTDYIINCAAFTAVDQAEIQPETAFGVNAGIPLLLGAIADLHNIRLIHISTDYVYDGTKSIPHTENETPAPASIYAQSKLEGEKHLWESQSAIIIRTSWLYGEFGKNFLKTMLHLGNERKELGIVFDQTGTPTYTGDLAKTLMEIISFSEKNEFIPGIYNYSNEGVCSWYEFASAFIPNAVPCSSAEFRRKALRPANSVLVNTKTGSLRDWREAIREYLQQRMHEL